MATKKLIEVALPLEKINAAATREKSIRYGHPASVHLWWARRPLAATRAVIWSSLVDDPSSHPELFPTEEDQNKERQRLFKILEDLVVWENSNNEAVLNAAKAEIMKSTDNNPPALLDPFAGGGAIPIEAQRLGLKAYAHDLNPIPVMINKALIDIPQRFLGEKPVNPDFSEALFSSEACFEGSCLSADIRYYGERLIKQTFQKIGYMYPRVKASGYPEGAVVIAWMWARTVTCPNPLCKCQIPLVRSFDLSRNRGGRGKSGTYASIDFEYKNAKLIYKVIPEKTKRPPTVSRAGGVCPNCGASFDLPYVRKEGCAGRIGTDLMAVIAEGKNGRMYLSVDEEQRMAADVPKPDNYPSGELSGKARENIPLYGMYETGDVFTNRQLTALTTLSNSISDLQKEIESDSILAGMTNDHIPLIDGGKGAKAYSEAVCTYLAFVVDQQANHLSSLCGWHVNNEQLMNTFGRQALPMVWDFAECNLFSSSTGSFNNLLDRVAKGVDHLTFKGIQGIAEQRDAQSDCGLRNIMVSTDPPYYDNICYADLSDFFYVWMRNSLKGIYPRLFNTILVPKAEELVASPFRFEGNKENARTYFENGMLTACEQLYKYTTDEVPVTIYYAFKDGDSTDLEDDRKSSGWEAILTSIINAGFCINGTWPMRTEQTAALKTNLNTLASSIVLVCRRRAETAKLCTRRNFINELKRELRPALQKLQSSNIAPVDLAQSAIGPGMGVYSKYSQVLEADGTAMSVRSALKVINQELDLYFNEQDSDLDSESRFCVDLYSQFAFNEMPFGDANTLATAKNTSVAIMASHGFLYAQKGKVHLIERQELPDKINTNESNIWLLCQQLTYKMEKEGVEGCTKAIFDMFGSNAERAKDLAYRLYTIAERKRWAQEAYAYNALVVAWPEIQSRAAELKAVKPEQMSLMDFLQ